MQNKIKTHVILPIALGMIGLTSCGESRPTPSITHLTRDASGLSEIWSLTNVYARQDAFTPMMVSSGGKIVLIASLTNNTEERLICLDGSNGDVLWEQKDATAATALNIAPDEVYVGYSGLPHVTKYELTTGKVTWSQTLNGRGLGYLFILGDEIQVSTDPFIHTVLDRVTGKIIRSVQDWQSGNDIYISTPEVTFMRPMRVTETDTGELIWQQDLDRELTLAPIFLDHIILVRTNRTIGSIYALDRASGAILWKTDANIISNIAYSHSNERIYALSRDGQLLGVDITNGQQVVLVEFSSVPFILNGEQVVGGYEIAFDESTQMLYVLLGDSRQLFAFKEE